MIQFLKQLHFFKILLDYVGLGQTQTVNGVCLTNSKPTYIYYSKTCARRHDRTPTSFPSEGTSFQELISLWSRLVTLRRTT